jgi:hypothetical protein
MEAADFPALIARHRDCFLSGRTRPVEWREAQLEALHALMTERAGDFSTRCGRTCAATASTPTPPTSNTSPTKPPMRAIICGAG